MGIDISAKLLYGLPYEDIPEEILDEVNAMLDDGDLDYASPYYDSPRSEWIVGKEISCYETTLHEVYCGIIESGDYLYDTILQKCETKIYVSPHVT